MRKCTRVHFLMGRTVILVTRKQVAQAANVSEATVSRVLNEVGPIRESTKQRVLQVAKQLNYHPHAIAQSFARRKSGNIGIIIPYVPKLNMFSTYYFAEILSGIGDEVRSHGYDLLLFMISPQEPIHYVKFYQSQKVDACMILGAFDSPHQRASLLELDKKNLPFCLINQRFEGLAFNEIDANHEQGSRLAVTHLLEQGYQKLAFLNGSPWYSNSQDRAKGFSSAMQVAGLNKKYHQFEGNYSRKSGYLIAPHIWEKRHEIDSIVVANDRMAIGLLQGLRELDPQEKYPIAVVGCDDSDLARLHHPPLTSIHVPLFEMGQVATKFVIDQLQHNQKQLPYRAMLDTHLVIRQSSSKSNS